MLGKLGEDVGAGRRGDVVDKGLDVEETVAWGLKVTVLCAFGGFDEFEIMGVGGGSSGDLSVEAEAIVQGYDGSLEHFMEEL